MRPDIGCLEARDTSTGARVAGMYCKVYARLKRGKKAVFFKDGYTDVAGQFWYADTNSGAITRVGEFAVLAVSAQHGARVLTSRPPAL